MVLNLCRVVAKATTFFECNDSPVENHSAQLTASASQLGELPPGKTSKAVACACTPRELGFSDHPNTGRRASMLQSFLV